MAENSEISWTDHTFNPWIGCTKVSPGCDGCYAEARMDTRLHRVHWGAGQPRVRTQTWNEPLKWNRQHDQFFAKHGRRQRVFCASLADVFDNEVLADWRLDLWDLCDATPNLDKLLLTKRIGNVKHMVPLRWMQPGGWPKHVWIGATVVNREEMLRDGPKLKALPSPVRFWSVEPMLGHLGEIPASLLPEWVIAGGESGHRARPMHPDWPRRLRDRCQAAGVPFHFKQWGEWADAYTCVGGDWKASIWSDGAISARVGTKSAGRLLDGVMHHAFPEVR